MRIECRPLGAEEEQWGSCAQRRLERATCHLDGDVTRAALRSHPSHLNLKISTTPIAQKHRSRARRTRLTKRQYGRAREVNRHKRTNKAAAVEFTFNPVNLHLLNNTHELTK